MSIETTGTRVELTPYGVAYTVRERHFTLDVTLQVLVVAATVVVLHLLHGNLGFSVATSFFAAFFTAITLRANNRDPHTRDWFYRYIDHKVTIDVDDEADRTKVYLLLTSGIKRNPFDILHTETLEDRLAQYAVTESALDSDDNKAQWIVDVACKWDERVKERQDIERVKDEFVDHHARLANEIVGRSLTVSRVVEQDAFDVDRFFRDPM